MQAINWHTVFFWLYALAAGGFAVAVVVSSNIVRMALYLIASLGATAGLFFLAGADFVGAMQILIYVGGTLVLLIFGVMLTAQGPLISLKTKGGDWVVALLLSGCLLALLVPAAFSVVAWHRGPAGSPDVSHASAPQQDNGPQVALVSAPAAEDATAPVARFPDANGDGIPDVQPKTATPLGMGLLGARVDKLGDAPENLKPGMSGYLLPFEVVSVHLLVVLIGAAYLARTKRRRVR